MVTISQIELELINNYVEITTSYAAPKGDPIPEPKIQHFSLKDSYFDRVYLNASKPNEFTDIEITNSINGNIIYFNLILIDQGLVYLNGEPVYLEGVLDFLSKYTAYVVLA